MLGSLASILDFMLMHHDRLVIEILGSLDDLIAQPARKYFHPREDVKKKRIFLGDLSQMWVGWVADSQTRSKPLNPPKSPRKFPFLTRISSFVFPNLTKTLGWVHTFGKTFPIKTGIFLGGLP